MTTRMACHFPILIWKTGVSHQETQGPRTKVQFQNVICISLWVCISYVLETPYLYIYLISYIYIYTSWQVWAWVCRKFVSFQNYWTEVSFSCAVSASFSVSWEEFGIVGGRCQWWFQHVSLDRNTWGIALVSNRKPSMCWQRFACAWQL